VQKGLNARNKNTAEGHSTGGKNGVVEDLDNFRRRGAGTVKGEGNSYELKKVFWFSLYCTRQKGGDQFCSDPGGFCVWLFGVWGGGVCLVVFGVLRTLGDPWGNRGKKKAVGRNEEEKMGIAGSGLGRM